MLCRNTSTMYDRTENYTTLSYGNIVKKGNGPICLILFSVYLSITNFLCCCVGVNWNGRSDSETQKIHFSIFITIYTRPDSYATKTSLKVFIFMEFDGILHNSFALVYSIWPQYRPPFQYFLYCHYKITLLFSYFWFFSGTATNRKN